MLQSEQLHIVAGSDPRYFCKKVIAMLTREQVLEVQSYCAEHRISQKARLEELNINVSQFYRWQQKYRQEDEQSSSDPGAFVQLCPGGEFVSPMMPPAKTPGKAKGKTSPVDNAESFLTVEIRTSAGTMMRIQGSMTAAHLHEIITAG